MLQTVFLSCVGNRDDKDSNANANVYISTVQKNFLSCFSLGIRAPTWPSTSFRVGSRLHRATPNMGILDESRFFTNPMITALLNKEAFQNAITEAYCLEVDETV